MSLPLLVCAQLHGPCIVPFLSVSTPNLGRGTSKSAFQGEWVLPTLGSEVREQEKGVKRRRRKRGQITTWPVALRPDPGSL